MDNEFLIHELLDGTLSAADEEKFFSLLASEGELRSEFKQQLAIKNALRSDVRAYTPRADSTLHIFNNLGLYLAPAAPVVVPGLGEKFLTFMKANAGYFVSGIVSAVSTALLIFMLADFSGGNGNNNSSFRNKSENQVVNAKPPVMTSENLTDNKVNENKNNAIVSSEKPNVVYKYIYVEKKSSKNENSNKEAVPVNNELNPAAASENNFAVNNINFAALDLQRNKTSLNFGQNHVMPNMLTNLPFESSSFGENKLTMEIRGSNYLMDANSGVKPMDNLPLLNTGVTFLYKLNDEWNLGLDYRHEQFLQKFAGLENGKFYDFEQQPSFWTVGVSAKYSPAFLAYEMFSPFASGSIGANASGPVGRFMLGTDVYLAGNYYLTFGADYSLLMFSQSGARFTSTKFGLNAGIGFKF